MSEPITWENLPMSQTDNTTIAEYVAAQIALHNDNADAHLGPLQSLQSHRAAEIIDHLAASIVPDKMTADVPGLGSKVGSFAQQGQSWTLCTSSPAKTPNSVIWGDYGGGRFVAVGSSSNCMTSDDGLTWTSRSGLSGYTLSNVKFGNGKYVAGAVLGAANGMAYSSDGVTWTRVAITNMDYLADLIFDGTQFVAIIRLTTGGSHLTNIYTSTDGVSWTAKNPTLADALTNIVYNEATNRYIAHASFFYMYRSSDLVTWTQCWHGENKYMFGLGYGQGQMFCQQSYDRIVGGDEVVDYFNCASPTGSTWAALPCPSDGIGGQCIFVQDTYFIVLPGDPAQSIVACGDNFKWQLQKLPGTDSIIAIAASPTRIVGISYEGNANQAVYCDIIT